MDSIEVKVETNTIPGRNGFADKKETTERKEAINERNNTPAKEATRSKTRGQVPDGGWGWFVVLGSCLSQAIGGGIERSKGMLYLQLQDHFQQSSTMISMVLTISSSMGVLCGPAACKLCDRYSCRVVGYVGAILCAIGLLLSGFSPTVLVLYATYGFIAGIGRQLVYASSLIIVGNYFKKRLGVAAGLSTAGNGIGIFAFPSLIDILFAMYGFTGAFIVLAAISLNYCVGVSLFRPLSRKITVIREITVDPDGHTETAITQNQNPKRSRKSLLTVLRNIIVLPDFSLLKNFAFTATCIQILFHHMAKQATFMFLPALAVSRGLSLEEAALLLSATGICELVSKVIMTIILDYKPIRKYRLLIYSSVVVLMGGVLVLFPSMSTFVQFVAGSVIYGWFGGTRSQKLIVITDTQGSEKTSNSMGWLLFFQGMGSFLGPTVAALYKDSAGDYGKTMYISAAFHWVGGLSMLIGTIWQFRKQTTKTLPRTVNIYSSSICLQSYITTEKTSQ